MSWQFKSVNKKNHNHPSEVGLALVHVPAALRVVGEAPAALTRVAATAVDTLLRVVAGGSARGTLVDVCRQRWQLEIFHFRS